MQSDPTDFKNIVNAPAGPTLLKTVIRKIREKLFGFGDKTERPLERREFFSEPI